MSGTCPHRVDAKAPSRTTLVVGVYEQDCPLCGVAVRFVMDEQGTPVLATEENTSWRPRVSWAMRPAPAPVAGDGSASHVTGTWKAQVQELLDAVAAFDCPDGTCSEHLVAVIAGRIVDTDGIHDCVARVLRAVQALRAACEAGR